MASSAASWRPLVPGLTLDRYELLCPIAEGGMASVWAARQRGKHGFQRLVAIKTILPRFAGDPHFQQMFLDEARITSRIEHPNVTQVLDLGEESQILYLAMEYVEGDSLSRLVKAARSQGADVPHGVLLRIAADACKGLHEAHELRDAEGHALEIVHRDVSPQNLLVSARGVTKIIDFGIAKARSRAAADTHAGVLKGKLSYMAPEQALGRRVDRRTDVWALGAVLYQALARRAPYDAETQLATVELLRSGAPPRPLPAQVPAPISALVRRALCFAPELRFATAAAFCEAMERVMAELGLGATTSEVALFVSQHLAEALKRRRAAIEAALAEADERCRTARSDVVLVKGGALRTTLHESVRREVPGAQACAPASAIPASPPGGHPRRRHGKRLAVGFTASLGLVSALGLGLRVALPPETPGTRRAVSGSEAPPRAAAAAQTADAVVAPAETADAPSSPPPTGASSEALGAALPRPTPPSPPRPRPFRVAVVPSVRPSIGAATGRSAPSAFAPAPAGGPLRAETVDDGF